MLHLHYETSIDCGLGIASISSLPCLSIDACTVSLFAISLIITLRTSEAAAQCIVIGPVCGFVCVFVGVFVGLLPR